MTWSCCPAPVAAADAVELPDALALPFELETIISKESPAQQFLHQWDPVFAFKTDRARLGLFHADVQIL